MDSTVVDMKGRSFLTLLDLSEEEILYLIDLAIDLKEKKKDGVPHRCLEGQNIALLFEKPSMIARSAYTAACVDAGAHPAYFGKEDLDFGTIKSLPDTAKVLGRMYDGIIFYGNKQTTVEDLAVHSGIPVWNGMTDTFYPSQLIADFRLCQAFLGTLIIPIFLALCICTLTRYRAIVIAWWPVILCYVLQTKNLTQNDRVII